MFSLLSSFDGLRTILSIIEGLSTSEPEKTPEFCWSAEFRNLARGGIKFSKFFAVLGDPGNEKPPLGSGGRLDHK
jgi:hypothetical protein